MPLTSIEAWNERLRETLRAYDEPLLREVAGKLCKPRNQWPVDELIDRCLDIVGNTAVLERRFKDLGSGAQMALALIGHGRQQRWHVGNLVEMLVALGQSDGLQPIQELLGAGLLYPDLGDNSADRARLKHFDQWLLHSNSAPLRVYAHPQVTALVLKIAGRMGTPSDAIELAPERGEPADGSAIYEADGLEWPLRISVLWQQVAASPLRKTQQGDFFKRDLDRLRGDPLLASAPADSLMDISDPGLLAVALACALRLVLSEDGTIRSGTFPQAWEEGIPAALASLWSALLHAEGWNAEYGWQPGRNGGNPYPSAYLLSILALAKLPEDAWCRPERVVHWVVEHHPYWRQSGETHSAGTKASAQLGLVRFLQGVAFQFRLIQAAKDKKGEWLVRLSATGRWLLGLGEMPPAPPAYPQTWLVQPSLEILVYRQGLTPALIAQLSRLGVWKGLGSACTMQLEPDAVYRGLESGETFSGMVEILERHSMKPLPASVISALKTWSTKRQRISVYPAAALFEFSDAAALDEALARGLPAVRLTDRLAAVADEKAIDYRHFRLTATRDYALPPAKCVNVESDGITLSVDQARSDLLLETELLRFAEPLPRYEPSRLQYRVTPRTLNTAREQGLSAPELENWFQQRTGRPLSPAARLLFIATETAPVHLRPQLVLHVPSAEIADGLQQWPATRALISDRLGPTALAVLQENVSALNEQLNLLGLKSFDPTSSHHS